MAKNTSSNLIFHFDAIKADWLTATARRTLTTSPPQPFITIARQAGAGGRTLAHHLAEGLNELDGAGPPWQAYDRELVERVAADHNLSKRLIHTLENSSHDWLRDLVESLVYPHDPSELKVFHRVAATIRAFAQAGRAIIVGRGGVFITDGMPCGQHIYLVAPLEHRVERMAGEWGQSRDDTEKKILELERNRQSFYRRHFPKHQVKPEAFTVTLNTAEMSDREMVDMLLPRVLSMAEAPSSKHP